MNRFTALGSVNQFAKEMRMDPKSPDTLEDYTIVLSGLRHDLGVSGYRDLGCRAVGPALDQTPATAEVPPELS